MLTATQLTLLSRHTGRAPAQAGMSFTWPTPVTTPAHSALVGFGYPSGQLLTGPGTDTSEVDMFVDCRADVCAECEVVMAICLEIESYHADMQGAQVVWVFKHSSLNARL